MAGFIDASELAQVAGDLLASTAAVAAGAGAVVRNSTADVEQDARELAPVLTGELRDSIHAVVHGLEGEVVADSDHAEYVEDGTSTMAPQPYMAPALARNESGFVRGFEKLTDRIL